MSDIVTALRGLESLHDLSDDELAPLAKVTRQHHYKVGDVIHKEGDPRTHVIAILDGHVEISREVGNLGPVTLVTYGPGDGLGQGALVGQATHTTTATALTDVTILSAPLEAVHVLLDADATIKAKVLTSVIRVLLSRLDRMAPQADPEALEVMTGETRTEHDLLGEKEVPAFAYYGVQTLRAMENFKISGVPVQQYPEIINAFAMIKLAAARANNEVGAIPDDVLAGIEAACQDIMDGKLHNQFLTDIFQGGAGTSVNMNANEVIANRALEHMGHEIGAYEYCDPHDHLNHGQSTNDAYPSALHIAILLGNDTLCAEIEELVAAFRRKGREFSDVVKMGRTQLQDAVPMTLGQEFAGWARSIENEKAALRVVEEALLDVNMGGTAIGTGLNAPAGYAERCVKHLAAITGREITLAPDLVEATQNTQPFVLYSSCLKSLGVKLSKICNDLRLLSSGPRAGFNEINLPAMQPGSSIMPGKVNPVIPEVVNQVCFKAIGNDLTVSMAAEAGQLELNVMEPVIISCVMESQTLFRNAARTLRVNCIDGITANADQCRHYVEFSIGVVTALNPVIGYEKATQLAAEALKTGRGVVELVREQGLLSEEQIQAVLDPKVMTGSSLVRE